VKRGQAVVSLVVLLVVAVGWTLVNPRAAFGISRYGVTTHGRVPLPYLDLQVREGGDTRWIRKTHDLDGDTLGWLLAPAPEVLIVGLGWRQSARLSPRVQVPEGTKLIAVSTDEALPLYNSLKARGVRVAIHVHSTC
jgi:hypothetical protein